MIRKYGYALLLPLLAFGLSGCYGLDKRYGLDPVLDAAAVASAAANHQQILAALAADASISPASPSFYYYVAEAGFNYIDDECRTYFQQLFFLDRDRDRIKSGLGAASATTAAILGVTGASVMSMAIVAQAFGLGLAATDIVANAYLFQLPPSTTQGFVKEMQLAYREGAAVRAGLIVTPTAAYHAVQEYLSLCLPPTIESKLAEHIKAARATPDPASGSRSTSFGINLVAAPSVSREQIRTMSGATAPPTLGPVVSRSTTITTGARSTTITTGAPSQVQTRGEPTRRQVTTREVTTRDQGVRRTEDARPKLPTNRDYALFIKDYNEAVHNTISVQFVLRRLCVPENELDRISSKTKALVKVYQQTIYQGTNRAKSGVTGMLTQPEIAQLNNQATCPLDRALNYYEAHEAVDGVNSPDLIGLLNKALPNGRKLTTTANVKDVRLRIPEARKAVSANLQLLDAEIAEQLTLDLTTALINLP